MPLSEAQEIYLNHIFDDIENCPAVSKWEYDFMMDQKQRYDQYEKDTRLSDKQWNVIFKIGDKMKIDRPGAKREHDDEEY